MAKAYQKQTRSIKLQQEEISYKFRYSSKAKYIRLQISHGSELELIIPRGCEIKEAEKFLIKKADWIKKHLIKTVKSEPKYLLLGKEIKVNHNYELFKQNHDVEFSNNELLITSPEGSKIKTEQIYDIWLKDESKRYIPFRVQELARKYNFVINRITIRGQKTRWGSCSSKGNLSFNFKLMRYRKEVIDYVIIHELCHLREMNHSKKFWSLVNRFCPDYKNLRKELKGGLD